MSNVFDIVIVISSVLMSLLILLQARGASLGAGFGGSSELFTARRGADKTLYRITIFLSLVFVGTIILKIIFG